MAADNALFTHTGSTDAQHGRLALGGLLAVQGPTAHDIRTGVLVGPGSRSLITGTSSTAPMQVSIAPHGWVSSRGAANGAYLGKLPAATLVDIAAAPGSGTRIDVVWEKQADSTPGVPSPDATTAPTYGVKTGTVGAGKPTLTDVPGAHEIGTVTVVAGATRTDSAGVTIANTARQTTTRGGIVPVANAAELALLTAYPTLQALELDTGRLRWHDGTRWRYDGDSVVVASKTERDALTIYAGLTVLQTDTGLRLIRVGSAWRLVSAEQRRSDNMVAGWAANSLNWAGATFGWVAGLGSKIVVPADGVARDVVVLGTCNVAEDGFLRIRRDFTTGAAGTVYWPNLNGKRSASMPEVELTLHGGETLDGSQEATYYLEAKPTVNGVADFLVPTLALTCT